MAKGSVRRAAPMEETMGMFRFQVCSSRVEFGGHGIDGIYQNIRLFLQYFIHGLVMGESGVDIHSASGVYIQNAPFGRFHFQSSQGGFQGKDLPVYICQVHPVEIDQEEMPHAAAGQGFKGIPPDGPPSRQW